MSALEGVTAMMNDPSRDSAEIRTFQRGEEAEVVELWRACGLLRPANDPFRDIARKERVGPHLFLVALRGGHIVGSVMGGYEGHRGWINYLAVDPAHRRRGIGRRLMAEAERLLRAEGCPKINLQVRASNREVLAFYASLGFAEDAVVSLGKRLVDEEPPQA